MTRRRAVVILIVVVGGILAMSLSTIFAGTENAPARYAQVSVGSNTLDIWRDNATHDLIFQWDGEVDASRYHPKRFTLTKLADGKTVSVHRYPSNAAAWHAIHGLYGVRWRRVRAALLAGNLSDLPSTAG